MGNPSKPSKGDPEQSVVDNLNTKIRKLETTIENLKSDRAWQLYVAVATGMAAHGDFSPQNATSDEAIAKRSRHAKGVASFLMAQLD